MFPLMDSTPLVDLYDAVALPLRDWLLDAIEKVGNLLLVWLRRHFHKYCPVHLPSLWTSRFPSNQGMPPVPLLTDGILSYTLDHVSPLFCLWSLSICWLVPNVSGTLGCRLADAFVPIKGVSCMVVAVVTYVLLGWSRRCEEINALCGLLRLTWVAICSWYCHWRLWPFPYVHQLKCSFCSNRPSFCLS